MFFFFNDTATTEIYTLSLHDALPICLGDLVGRKYTFLVTIVIMGASTALVGLLPSYATIGVARSEEHTSELQSRQYLVCRLLLEKKKQYHRLLLHSLDTSSSVIHLTR